MLRGEERGVAEGSGDDDERDDDKEAVFALGGEGEGDVGGAAFFRGGGGGRGGGEGEAGHAAAPVETGGMASARIFSCVASWRWSCPAIEPARMTRMRSERSRTSGRSEEITRMPMPEAATLRMSL